MAPAFPSSDGIEISPADVADALAAEQATVIDVREQYERDAGHIAGTRHVEIERVASQSDSIDREQPVIFYCRLGTRSAMVAEAFRASGFDAYTMTGGLEAWAQEGRPLEPEGGSVAPH